MKCFFLLINEINHQSFCFVTCFRFIFMREALPHRGLVHTIFCSAYLRIRSLNLPWEFVAGICRGYLLQKFAVGICRRNLLWPFAAGICCGYLPPEFSVGICRRNLQWGFAVTICREFFVYITESFLLYVSKSCLYRGKPFLYLGKTFWFVRFSLLTVFLLDIVMAVMGHRRRCMKSAIFRTMNLNYKNPLVISGRYH